MRKKYGFCVGMLMLFMLAALGSVTVSAADRKDGVVSGRSVYIHSDEVAFWGSNNLLCTGLVTGSGEIYDIVSEGAMPEELRYVAVYGDHLYIGNLGGVYRVSLDDMLSGQGNTLELYDSSLIDGFEIYDDYLYYRAGDNVYRVSVNGSAEELIVEGTKSFSVTIDGIYYIDANDRLYLTALDGSWREFLIDVPEDSHLQVVDDFIYYRGDAESVFYCYSLLDEREYRMDAAYQVRDQSPFWVNESYLLFYSEELDVYRVDLQTGDVWLMSSLYSLPDFTSGTFEGNMLYHAVGASLYVTDVANDTDYDKDIEEVLGIPSEFSEIPEEQTMHPEPAPVFEPVDDHYNILENLSIHSSGGNAIIETEHVYIYAPGDISWDIEAIDNNAFEIYYVPGRNSGYGGHVVTIRAYDWADNSYAEFPYYKMAGLSEDKKYVAIYPTDVQFDYNDGTQAEEYMRMLTWAERMDCEAENVDNPFMVNAF